MLRGLNHNSAGFHVELFRNEDTIIDELRKEGLAHPDFKEEPKVKESRDEMLADINDFLEATTNVRAQVRTSTKGKKFNVKAHDRKLTKAEAQKLRDKLTDLHTDIWSDDPSPKLKAKLDGIEAEMEVLDDIIFGKGWDSKSKKEKKLDITKGIADKGTRQWASKLTSDEKDALLSYAEIHFDIQDGLRSGESLGRDLGPIVKNLDSAINKYKSDKDMTFYRGVNFEDHKESNAYMKQLKSGVLSDAAYLSVATKPSVAKMFSAGIPHSGVEGKYRYYFNIKAPKGVTAAPLKVLKALGGESVSEHEYLLPRKNKLKIVKINKKGKVFHVDAEYVVKGKLKEATQLVSAYARVRKGKRQYVRQYNREYTPAVENMKIIGATDQEQRLLRALFSHHDDKVLKAVSFVAVADKGKVSKMLKKVGWKHGTKDVVAWYDETKRFIMLNRDNLKTLNQWRDALNHEFGHAAYYHSSNSAEWKYQHQKDIKFDRFTWYSKTDEREAFAESYMAYIAAGRKAKDSRYKKVFKAIDAVVAYVNPKTNFYNKLIKPAPNRPEPVGHWSDDQRH